jgi:peptidoglycan/LPS O-acetylase OafA/YrhL
LTAAWRDLLRSKLLLFAWVFCIWGVIGSAAFVLGTASNGRRVSLWDTAESLLWSPLVPKLELWFIWALTLFFVVAKLTRVVNRWAQLAVAGAVAALALSLWLNTTTGLTGSAKYYFFFLAGIYLRDVILRFSRTSSRLVQLSVVVLWAAVSVTLPLLGIRDVWGLYFVNCVLGVCAGIVLSRGLARLRVLGRIGQQTLAIYLAHTPIIIVLSFALSLTPVPQAMTPDLLATPLVASGAVLVALLLHHWCSRRRVLRHLYTPPLHLLDRPISATR